MNIKNRFKTKYDNITINNDFNEIKNNLNYNPIIKKEPKQLKPLFYLLAPLALILIIMIPLLINGANIKKEPNITDFKKYEIKLSEISTNTSIENELININYPLMYNACNLEENIEVNAKYDVLKDGKVVNKENLNLEIGENNYEVVVYKLDKIDKTYKLNITVGK